MKTQANAQSFSERNEESRDRSDRYYSVEFFLDKQKLIYQSRLWNNTSKSMFTLVKEDSDILDLLNVGDVLKMKYYCHDTVCPTKNLDTKIQYITKDKKGRFKGHYMVGLAILQD